MWLWLFVSVLCDTGDTYHSNYYNRTCDSRAAINTPTLFFPPTFDLLTFLSICSSTALPLCPQLGATMNPTPPFYLSFILSPLELFSHNSLQRSLSIFDATSLPAALTHIHSLPCAVIHVLWCTDYKRSSVAVSQAGNVEQAPSPHSWLQSWSQGEKKTKTSSFKMEINTFTSISIIALLCYPHFD